MPILLFLLCALAGFAEDPYSTRRAAMVRDQIEARGISNADVLRVMRETPRHEFVPLLLRSLSYADHPVPIGHAATISQPFIVAIMTQLLEPLKSNKVLEIGTGSGYQAAILSPLVAQVYTIELVPELAASARDTLARLRYKNVFVRQGNGYVGWPEQAPFDRIIVTAAPPDLPEVLVAQLANRGRLVAPVGGSLNQDLVVVTKDGRGKVERKSAGAVSFVPMRPTP